MAHQGKVDIEAGLGAPLKARLFEKMGVSQWLATNHYLSFGFGLAVARRVALSRVVVVWDLGLPGVRFFALVLVVLFGAAAVRAFPPVTARTLLGELILALAAIAALLGLPGPNLMAAA